MDTIQKALFIWQYDTEAATEILIEQPIWDEPFKPAKKWS